MTDQIETIELRNGNLRFSASSMGQGPLVILLHGFPDTRATFDHQVDFLANQGYRAVAVSSRGYEQKSQPGNGDYHLSSLAQDVFAWADCLDTKKFHLVGHDWGATIGFAATRLSPERIASFTALAVPQPARFAAVAMADKAQRKRSTYIAFFQLRGLAEWIVERKNWAYLRKLWQAWSPEWRFTDANFSIVQDAFSKPGVKKATLAYYRQALDRKSDEGTASLALQQPPVLVPTLGLCGAQDGCIGDDIFKAAMKPEDFPGGLNVECLSDAGHFLHVERSAAVNRNILNWLKKNPV